MLMLQLEVNISSSQGFSLVNLSQAYTKDFARPVDHIFIESVPLFPCSSVPYVPSFILVYNDLN